jgi:hypothetical protein
VREMTPTVIQIDLRGLVYPGFVRKLCLVFKHRTFTGSGISAVGRNS